MMLLTVLFRRYKVPEVVEKYIRSLMAVCLNSNQKPHAEKLLEKLESFQKAIDCSPTGTGKTYVSCYVAQYLQKQGKIDEVRVICPPSLSNNWKRISIEFNLKNIKIHGYDKSVYPKTKGNCLLIMDEFHLLKNTTARYNRVSKFIDTCVYTIGLSATPMDKTFHYDHYKSLFRGGIRKLKCSMGKVKIPYHQVIQYQRDNHTKFVDMYQDGFDMLSNVRGNPDTNFFTGKLYTDGIRTLHRALYSNLVRICKNELNENPNRKVIILEVYSEFTSRLMKDFKEYKPLLMNGSVSYENRTKMIEKFQTPSNKHRLIITSAQIGGVGVSLDDTNGNYPRTTLVMPLGNYLDFVQALGRTLRTNTRSDSKVIVVQPHSTIPEPYMKRVIDSRGSVLDNFLV